MARYNLTPAPIASHPAGSPNSANYHPVSHGASPLSTRSHQYGYNATTTPTTTTPSRSQPHRYVSAYEDFRNRSRQEVINSLLEAYGPDAHITDEDIDRTLAEHWESLDPAVKRGYGDRREIKNDT